MASALLASRNELCWGETKVYMRKPPISGPIPKLGTNPNPNLNTKAGEHASDRPRQIRLPEYDDPAATAAAISDDSSSFNRKSVRRKGPQKDSGGYITFNISSYSRREVRELKRRLVSELDQVRSLACRIESRELQSSARSIGYSTSAVYGGGGGGGRDVTSSAVLHPSPFQTRDSLLAGSDALLERPAPMANQYCKPPELLAGKERKSFGGTPVISPRGTKPLAAAPEAEKILAGMMSKCSQILTKLLKHKGSVWFNSPVDVAGMGLHDYHHIIKHPMDLGTVKSKLTEGRYLSPLEVAADVRLTFNNALLYNQEGHEVHILASQLLRLFDAEFCPAYEKYEKKQAAIAREEEKRKTSACSHVPVPDIALRAAVIPVPVPPLVHDKLQRPIHNKPLQPQPIHNKPLQPQPIHNKPLQQQLVHDKPPPPQLVHDKKPPPPQQQHPVVGRQVMGKLPKPKAKDVNKRPMSYAEKGKLSEGLQSLPQEKMAQVLQIVRRRNVDPVLDGDEIELDFEVLNTETLWELDRFVGYCKKMMSKIKRQESMGANPISAPLASLPAEVGDKSPMAGEAPDTVSAKRIKKGDAAEDDDVDIGEELPSTIYPPVEIEKDAGNASSSGGSGSDSSSSSDSDSESSSGSDSGDRRPSPRN